MGSTQLAVVAAVLVWMSAAADAASTDDVIDITFPANGYQRYIDEFDHASAVGALTRPPTS